MNIVYIHTHDTGRLLSPYGYQVPTPQIRAFAEDALVLRNCYTASPTCSPSRAALLTGMYPHENGMLGLAQRGFSIDYKKHLVHFLKEQDYHTVLSGIQHEAGWYLTKKDSEPIGYDENLTIDSEGYRQEDLVRWDMENAGKVEKWLMEYQSEQPFFLSYGMFATHRKFPDWIAEDVNEDFLLPPAPLPDSIETRRDFARFMTSVEWADRCVGRVLEGLKKSGHYENTIIMLTTDHGIPFPYGKCSLFDSGIGVAMILRVPGSKTNGMVSDSMISQLDIFPTLCDLLNFAKPEYLSGVSALPVLRDVRAEVRNEIFAEVTFHTSYEPIRCVRSRRYKYIRWYDKTYLKINQSNMDESISKDYLVANGLEEQEKYEEALFDLIYDTGERNNLIAVPQYAQVAATMSETLDRHLAQTHDKITEGEIPIEPGWKVNKKECRKASSKNPNDYISLGIQSDGRYTE